MLWLHLGLLASVCLLLIISLFSRRVTYNLYPQSQHYSQAPEGNYEDFWTWGKTQQHPTALPHSFPRSIDLQRLRAGKGIILEVQ